MNDVSQRIAPAAIRKTIDVKAPVDHAFAVFAARMGEWWHKEHSIARETTQVDVVIEPRAGGRWYELGEDGSECVTGHVTAFEPPHRLVLAWHLDGKWAYDPDPAHASEVEVRFVAEGEDSTRVELEHRHFDRHGPDAPAVRGAVEDPSGWDHCLNAYLTLVSG